MRKLAFWILVLFVFTVPWEYSFAAGADIARDLALLTVAAALLAIFTDGAFRSLRTFHVLILVLCAYFAITSLWSFDAKLAGEEVRRYLQVTCSAWLIWELGQEARAQRTLLRALVCGCYVLALLSLAEFFSLGGAASNQTRFAGSEGQNPNEAARLLAFAIPVAMFLYATEKSTLRRLFALLYLPAAFFASLLSGSRGGAIALAFALGGGGAILLRRRSATATILLLAGPLIFVLLLQLAPEQSLARIATLPSQIQGGDLNDRLEIWRAAMGAFEEHPFFGVGVGSFVHATKLPPALTAHNTFLGVLTETGAAGLAVFLLVLGAMARSLLRMSGIIFLLWTSVALSWAAASFSGTLQAARITWVIFGLIVAMAPPKGGSRSHSLVNDGTAASRFRRLPALAASVN